MDSTASSDLGCHVLGEILDSMQDAVTSFSLVERRFIYVSPSAEKVLGRSKQAFIDDPDLLTQIIHPDDLDRTLAAGETCRREGLAEVEHRLIWPNGEVRRVHRRCWANHDEQNRPIRINAAFRDITEDQQIEAALAESELLHRLTLSNISDAVFITDDAGAFTYVCPNVHFIFDLSQSQVEALGNIDALLGGDLFDRQALQEQGEIANIERDIRNASGQTRHLLITVKCTQIKDGTTLYACRDITERKQAEIALQTLNEQLEQRVEERTVELLESKERLEMALEGTGAGVWEWKIQTDELYLDARCGAIIGYALDELEPTGISGLFNHVHPEDLDTIRARLEAHFSGSTPLYECEIRLKHRQGHWVWADVRGKVVEWTADGLPLRMLGTQVDSTALKQAELTMAEEHNLFRTVIDTIPDFIYVKNTQHRMLLNNRAHLKSLAQGTYQDALGKTDWDLFPETLASRFIRDDEQVLQTGQAIVNAEERSIGVDGNEISALTTKVPLRNLQGDLIGLVGITRDITEIKASQQALRESEERYRLLAEHVKDVIVKTTPDGIQTFATPSAFTLIGYTPDELIGRPIIDLVYPDDRAATQATVMRALSGNLPFFTAEHRLQHKHGRAIWVDLTATIVRDEHSGNPLEVVGVIRDISERKQAEIALTQALAKEKELSDLKTRFVSMASHEFRTPLAAILAVVETLTIHRDKLSEEKIDIRLDRIRDQVIYLTNILDDVLTLARIQAGKLGFNPTQVDLSALCASILEEFRSIETFTHRIDYHVPAALPKLMLDQKLMRQMISNLISNAVKYSPGVEEISVHLDYRDAEVILVVKDKGIGISASELKHLYEPFHRAANVGTISGTGLGLAIAKEAVDLHGGSIDIESRVGRGTTFTVRIPVHENPDGDAGE